MPSPVATPRVGGNRVKLSAAAGAEDGGPAEKRSCSPSVGDGLRAAATAVDQQRSATASVCSQISIRGCLAYPWPPAPG